MTRRSQRIQAKTVTASTDLRAQGPAVDETAGTSASENDDDFEMEEEEDRRPLKRVKRTKSPATRGARKGKGRIPEQFRGVRGKTGLLEKLAKDVPLDVILEIFCYLDPGDLLRLARTTRDLRGILMSKTSEGVWRTAREGVDGLPPLPKDLNEPQFAHFLYEPYCHVCGRDRCETVYWAFRMRCCKICKKYTFFKVDNNFLVALPLKICANPCLIPLELMSPGAGWERDRTMAHYPKITERYIAEFKELQTEEDRLRWIALKTEEHQTMEKHKYIYYNWVSAKQAERDNERNDIRKQRKEAILERLVESGLREEAELIMKCNPYDNDEFTRHKLVWQPKKLTDRGWNSIKDELGGWLRKSNADRLQRQRRYTIANRYAVLNRRYAQVSANRDLRDPFPERADVLFHKLVEDMISDTSINQDELSDAKTMETEFDECLPKIVEQWKSERNQELLQCLRMSRPNAAESELYLAATVFECTHESCGGLSGGRLMHYSQVFHHGCCFHTAVSASSQLKQYCHYSGPMWSARFLILSSSGCQIITKILEACSLDPATATVQDLHDANPLIECESCADPRSGSRAFMRWPCAVGEYLHRNHTMTINAFGD